MMMRAYDKSYLSGAMECLGEMLDYAVRGCGRPMEAFYDRFLANPLSEAFGNGAPKYIAGMSGIELAEEVSGISGSGRPEGYSPGAPGVEYWCGWALAYLQWHCGRSFAYIQNHGLSIGDVAKMYNPLHEADVSKFAEIAERRMEAFSTNAESPVKKRRTALTLTQQALADKCGITLRMVQAYEQRRQDLSKAEGRTLLNLSRALCCSPEDLI